MRWEGEIGLGDQLIGTGLARGALARGRRIAFGDGKKIIWDQHSEQVFRNNPNIARPESRIDEHTQWVPFYKGHRIYNRPGGDRWIWNMDFRPVPGEIYFDEKEAAFGRRHGKGFVVIEPDVPGWKSYAANKDWGFDNFQKVADRLGDVQVVQFKYRPGARMLEDVEKVWTHSFREALAVLSNAALYIGPEGGLHHAAAALGVPAVVIFGGFVPPQVTGYPGHVNLTGGATEFCGLFRPCDHCRKALANITVDEVVDAAAGLLDGR